MKTLNPISFEQRYGRDGRRLIRQTPPLRRNRPRWSRFSAFLLLCFSWVVLMIEVQRGAFNPFFVDLGWKQPPKRVPIQFRVTYPTPRPQLEIPPGKFFCWL